MDKCRICLKSRNKLLPVHTKVDGITFVDMITSIANVKICNDDGATEQLCSSCRKKLTDAYYFKLDIERSDSVLRETSNMKRISFSNLSDIKIKIEIDTDFKPIIPRMENFSEKLFQDDTDCISYNNTLIKKIKTLGDDNNEKSLSVGEFLNSLKIESDINCDYPDYELVADDYNDSGSDYSYDKCLTLRKTKKKVKMKKQKGSKKIKTAKLTGKYCTEYKVTEPIKPKFLTDLRLARTEIKKTTVKNRRPVSNQISVCPYCGKLCKTLNSHILLHTAEKTFKCDQCPKAFITEQRLKSHEKVHSERMYKCDQCVAAFNIKSSLKDHMLMHRDERNHVCDICSKAFKRKALLTRHKMVHNFGNKPIQCEICPMSFNTPYGLRHHMRVHTGERPFRCELCSQPYSYKHDFNRHCLKKHGVFLKRRSVYVMNEEVLQQERALMRDLSLRVHGIVKGGEIENPFDGPQAALAYEQAVKAIEANKIPIIY